MNLSILRYAFSRQDILPDTERLPTRNTSRQAVMQISGKTFIVTGGASGLGRASAETIVAAGGNVVLLDVNAETGHAAAQAIGTRAKFAQADVTSEEQVKAAVDLAVSSFGGLHG